MTVAADLVLRNGSVFTADAARRSASAVAVRDGRIIAVGHDEDVQPLIGPGTRLVDLDGRSVLPGFQDAHVHPQTGGLLRDRCALHGCRDAESTLAAVRAYAAAHPEREWILGAGWSADHFLDAAPTATRLDEAVRDRPAYITNRDGHSAWLNTAALARAGITAQTPDPPGGRVERDPAGNPTGTLHEDAMTLARDLLPPVRSDDLERALLAAQDELHALGVTAWNDASVEEDALVAYRALAERDALTMRCVLSLLWDRSRGPEQVADLAERRRLGTIGRVRAPAVKFFQDGVIETFTASLLEPYRHGRGHCKSLIEATDLARFVTLIDRDGFQANFHTIGDRAVREALDACEAALRANGRRASRHHLAHVQLVHPDDIPRFRRLGVIANCQPYWACTSGGYLTEMTLPFLGPERSTWIYPFETLRRAGATLAFGSDWTVSTPNPLEWIEVAVTRIDVTERDAQPFLPDERLDLPTALAAATINAAHVNGLDTETGSLEPGKAADLVVLDRDLFDRSAGPIGDARVALTLVDGTAVYDDRTLTW